MRQIIIINKPELKNNKHSCISLKAVIFQFLVWKGRAVE